MQMRSLTSVQLQGERRTSSCQGVFMKHKKTNKTDKLSKDRNTETQKGIRLAAGDKEDHSEQFMSRGYHVKRQKNRNTKRHFGKRHFGKHTLEKHTLEKHTLENTL